MNSSLFLFIRQLFGVLLAALVPVVLVAFFSIPYSLGGHPGEERTVAVSGRQHMT
jgi:hypothetical protein